MFNRKKTRVKVMKKSLITALACGTMAILLNGCSCDMKTKEEASKDMTTNSDVQTTASGLKYKVLTPAAADAKKAQSGKKVKVHYTGYLDDNGKLGKKFDSSHDHGQAFEFVLGSGMVIKGWDEGLNGMAVGEKRQFIIPAALGYGAAGYPPVIPQNATLIFDVELLEVA